LISLHQYRPKAAFQGGGCWSYHPNWEIFGQYGNELISLNDVSESWILSDGQWHEFSISKSRKLQVDEIRLCHIDRNGTESRDLHIGAFIISDDVFGPPEILRRVISPFGLAAVSVIPTFFPDLTI
jgi:hypothetical protein